MSENRVVRALTFLNFQLERKTSSSLKSSPDSGLSKLQATFHFENKNEF